MAGLKTTVERLRDRIALAIGKTESAPVFSFETVLLILSFVYGGVMRLRARLYTAGILPSRSLPCRVISIGNITAGGTGKTPMTIMVARLIREMGYRVVVISRGYRGRLEATGGIVSDGETIFLGPEDAGDEPSLMARVLKGIPVLVGRRRYETGMLAVKRFNPDVIVLDDAFQHMGLKRDLNLVLLDSRLPFGNGYLLPRGLLREPVSSLCRADVVAFTRSEPFALSDKPKGLPAQKTMVRTLHKPLIRKIALRAGPFLTHVTDMSELHGKRALAFAGLADNEQFFASLEQAGCVLEKTISFPDHYRYGEKELERLVETAEENGVNLLITTFKDYIKIQNWGAPINLAVIDVTIQLVGNEDTFRNLISEILPPKKA